MKIYEKIEIGRPAPAVWAFVEDPEQRQRWNHKFKGAVPISGHFRRRGHTFKATYVMSGRETVCQGEILDYDAPVRLRIQLEAEGGGMPFRAVEDYRLTPTTTGTLFEQEINVEMKINPLLRLLIWFLTRFGKPQGEQLLVGFKRLVETGDLQGKTGEG